MKPVRATSIGLVVAMLVLGVALGWSGVALAGVLGITVQPAPWSAALGLVFFAALLGAGAWYVYDRVHRKGRGVDPLLAVRLFVLGKASALVGALVGGAYGGYALRFVAEFAVPDARDKVWTGLAAFGAGVLVVVVALLLERACRVPKEGDGTGEAEADEDEIAGARGAEDPDDR
ncbi:MAG TPA: DUF3180 domain-containing protein [Actinopolymorphaceae bacterium]